MTEVGVTIMKWTTEGSLLISTTDWTCGSFKHLNVTHFAQSKQLNLHCTFHLDKRWFSSHVVSLGQMTPHETSEVPDSWCNGGTDAISSAAGTNSFNLVLFSLWQQVMKDSSRGVVLHVLPSLTGFVHCWAPTQHFFNSTMSESPSVCCCAKSTGFSFHSTQRCPTVQAACAGQQHQHLGLRK